MSTATIDVAVPVGAEILRQSAPVVIRDLPKGVLLGSFGTKTDGSTYLAPAGTPPLATHNYAGPAQDGSKTVYWNHTVTTLDMVFNFRPAAKPDQAVHPFSGVLTNCGVCGRLPGDRVHQDMALDVLTGKLNWLIDLWIQKVKSLGRPIIGTVWHEPLQGQEFMPGEPLTVWSEVFLYVMDRFAAQGASNVHWYSCFMASQYSNPGMSSFVTSTLLSRLEGVGADCYFTANSPTPDTHNQFKAFAAYHTEMKHALLEVALWSDTADQGKCYDAIDAYYKAHPNFTALIGFFNSGGTGKDGRLATGGVSSWNRMCADKFYVRTVA